ncbi:hypothetical protein FQA39_LY00393 [Lamprigera yunnana]|nr:hypothetical protein FQA39_LY00393 [Lamprigera yunnana]
MFGNRSRTEKTMDLAGCSRIPSHMTTTKEVLGDVNTLNRPDKSAEIDYKSTSSDQHENLVLVEGGTNENYENNFVTPRSNNECQVLVEEPMNTTAVANDGKHRDAVIYAVSSCGTKGRPAEKDFDYDWSIPANQKAKIILLFTHKRLGTGIAKNSNVKTLCLLYPAKVAQPGYHATAN